MKTYISLDKNVECGYLCNIVSKLINQLTSKNIDLSDKILTIEIKDINDEHNTVPNIEYKPENGV